MTTKTHAAPRAVPAAGLESQLDELLTLVQGEAFGARGLARGAALTAAQVKLASDDAGLQSASASLTAVALQKCLTISQLLDLPGGAHIATAEGLQQAEVAFTAISECDGQLHGAHALLDAMCCRDEHDDLLMALNGYELARERLGAAGRALSQAIDLARANRVAA